MTMTVLCYFGNQIWHFGNFLAESMHTFGPVLSYLMAQCRNLKVGIFGIFGIFWHNSHLTTLNEIITIFFLNPTLRTTWNFIKKKCYVMKKITLCSDRDSFFLIWQPNLAFLAFFFAEGIQTFGPVLNYFMVAQRNLKGVAVIVVTESTINNEVPAHPLRGHFVRCCVCVSIDHCGGTLVMSPIKTWALFHITSILRFSG